jgi:hypothetical protein
MDTTCSLCKVSLCKTCWYDDCCAYCPICEREDLNMPRQCKFCEQKFHVRHIVVCSECSGWICKDCDIPYIHGCRTIAVQPKGCSDISVILGDLRAAVYFNDALRVIGTMECPFGNVGITKEGDDSVVFSWLSRDAQKSADICEWLGMNVHSASDISICEKTITNASTVSGWDEVEFLHKLLSNTVMCKCCNLQCALKNWHNELCTSCYNKSKAWHAWKAWCVRCNLQK